ncbi:MAG: sugar ABC transporter ATP-binding protein [Leptolinea sp.]|nr:sugar ABC transporter ATP-binding protein [Leptolinea sp.]
MKNNNTNVILEIKEVSKAFPGVKALDRVSLEIMKGTIHGIVGENGAGKSTLMKILSGVYEKDSGEIIFDGKKIESITPAQSMKLGLSIIYQELNLVNTMSVGENIFLGRFGEMGGRKGVHSKARALLDSIGCKIDTKKEVSELSVSDKQMIEIAKALSFDSKLIIMDEPSSSLTSDEMKQLVQIIHDLKNKGISIIYITHKLDEIFDLCNSVTIMRDGKVIDTRKIDAISRNEMISMMVGRTIENEYPPRPNFVGETILEIKEINSKKLKDVSFNLKKGEILGFVGLVGAGRTEIARAIFGADKVQKTVLLDGKPVNINNPIDAINYGLAMVPEDRKIQGLLLQFAVDKNISLASLKKLTSYGFVNEIEEKKISERHIKSLSIKTPSIKTKIQMLSGGNQQKAILGRWLEIKPRILILDEPTKGIDVGAKYEIYMLMKKIVEDGSAIILISSELNEVLSMSNRVITICDGKITGEFDPTQAAADEILSKAFDFGCD